MSTERRPIAESARLFDGDAGLRNDLVLLRDVGLQLGRERLRRTARHRVNAFGMYFDLQQVSVMMGRPLDVPKTLKHYALDDARSLMSELRRLGL